MQTELETPYDGLISATEEVYLQFPDQRVRRARECRDTLTLLTGYRTAFLCGYDFAMTTLRVRITLLEADSARLEAVLEARG